MALSSLYLLSWCLTRSEQGILPVKTVFCSADPKTQDRKSEKERLPLNLILQILTRFKGFVFVCLFVCFAISKVYTIPSLFLLCLWFLLTPPPLPFPIVTSASFLGTSKSSFPLYLRLIKSNPAWFDSFHQQRNNLSKSKHSLGLGM